MSENIKNTALLIVGFAGIVGGILYFIVQRQMPIKSQNKALLLFAQWIVPIYLVIIGITGLFLGLSYFIAK